MAGRANLDEMTTAIDTDRLTVAGTTTSVATNVTVNGLTAASYCEATFAKEGFEVASGSNAFTAIPRDDYGRCDTDTTICYLPSSISFSYDPNGNLPNDGRRYFEYDDENQMVAPTTCSPSHI